MYGYDKQKTWVTLNYLHSCGKQEQGVGWLLPDHIPHQIAEAIKLRRNEVLGQQVAEVRISDFKGTELARA